MRPATLAGVVALAVLAAAAGQALLVRAVVVPTGSMRPTLHAGDRLLVDRVTLDSRAPRRGEVVVVRRPGAAASQGLGRGLRSLAQGWGLLPLDPDVAVIRRVVGLPGEVVETRRGVVHVDGEALAEPYANVGGRDVGPVAVPARHYWLVGDNRAAAGSGLAVGPVAREHLIGRAVTVLWPPSRLFDELHGSPRPAVRAERGLPWPGALDRLASGRALPVRPAP